MTTIKKTNDFICESCDFKCSKKNNYEKHLTTRKHKTTTNNNIDLPIKTYDCVCGKSYNHRASLFNHNKKCKYEPPKPKLYEKEDIVDVLMKENMDFKNIIMEVVKNNAELLKQNQEFQKQMVELYKSGISGGNNTTIGNTVISNSHNKTFNMQFFLNEQCKDAMNLMDFVDSMTLEFSDLEDVGKLGYVEGISNIIIRKLNELDIHKRPIHCSDAKREIMFVKDDDIWEKENSTYDRLRKAIKYITKKNGDLMLPWSQNNPMCMNTSHPLNDTYIQIMGQSMGGKESFVESENKIMKKIAKSVLIDKSTL
jgi:hypothetical protein